MEAPCVYPGEHFAESPAQRLLPALQLESAAPQGLVVPDGKYQFVFRPDSIAARITQICLGASADKNAAH